MDFQLDQGIAVLERTPPVLRSLLQGLDPAWVEGTEGSDTWSPRNVVGHLIDGEETDWMARARIILAQGPDRTFTPFDRTRHLTAAKDRSLEELLDRFAELRAANLRALREWKLTPDQLQLTGMHPELGQVTLAQLLATWVAHDLDHLTQIARVMARQYDDAVGPWRAYLRVIRDPVT